VTAAGIAVTCLVLIVFGTIWRFTQAVLWILNGRRS
jgi:hypothetical protein